VVKRAAFGPTLPKGGLLTERRFLNTETRTYALESGVKPPQSIKYPLASRWRTS